MEKLKDLRKKIDELDKVIMKALDERLEYSKEIGKIKALYNIKTVDEKRENEILKKANDYNNKIEIQSIYQEIFTQSKNLQEYKYFLVGERLNYSYSPLIYKYFGINNYNLFPTNDFKSILNIDFKGINITNPYKKVAYQICDCLDDSSRITNVVNTIVRENGKLKGFNTDYYGFIKTLEYYNVNLNNKKVLIVGNGATATTIKRVLESRNALKITSLVRTIKDENEFLLSDYNKFIDYEVIINATPHGTYPNTYENYLFPLEEFSKLETLIDVVYNPLNTPLLLNGKKGVKKINGLYMLISQAAYSASIYLNKDLTYKINEVYKNILSSLINIVLIGMPYSGKSKIGLTLSEMYNYNFVDLDQIMKENNHDLKTILINGFESDFRRLEVEYAKMLADKHRYVIATGGGIIKRSEAINALKQNGIIVFLDEKLDVLKQRIDDTRPLIKSSHDLEKLYYERRSLYQKYSDIIVEEIDAKTIMEKVYEFINN